MLHSLATPDSVLFLDNAVQLAADDSSDAERSEEKWEVGGEENEGARSVAATAYRFRHFSTQLYCGGAHELKCATPGGERQSPGQCFWLKGTSTSWVPVQPSEVVHPSEDGGKSKDSDSKLSMTTAYLSDILWFPVDPLRLDHRIQIRSLTSNLDPVYSEGSDQNAVSVLHLFPIYYGFLRIRSYWIIVSGSVL